MAPVYDKAIQATKDTPSFTEKIQLDADAISLYEDAGEDEKAEEELLTQLMGGKFSTGKMIRHASTSKRFLMVARIKKRIEDKNAQKKNPSPEPTQPRPGQ